MKILQQEWKFYSKSENGDGLFNRERAAENAGTWPGQILFRAQFHPACIVERRRLWPPEPWRLQKYGIWSLARHMFAGKEGWKV